MKIPSEVARIEALSSYSILDSEHDVEFDDFLKLIVQISKAPIVTIAFATSDRVWFKARHGIEALQIPREEALCNITIQTKKMVHVSDLSADERFSKNAEIKDGYHFYASFPLISKKDNEVIGTICILDKDSRSFSDEQIEMISIIAKQIMRFVELRDVANKQKDLAEKFDIISSNIADVVWMGDPRDNKILFVSKSYEKIWERSSDKLFQDLKSLLDGVHPDDLENVKVSLKLQREFDLEDNFRIITPEGEIKWIHRRSFIVKNKDNQVYRIVGIFTDITGKKKVEDLLKDQQAKMVNTAKLSSLGEMAAGVAHEINNPLTIIMGNAQILKQLAAQKDLDQKALTEISETIQNTIVRVSKIITGLKNFARDGGSEPFEKASLQSIVQETLSFCEARFKNHGVRLEVNIPKNEIILACRRVQISQVILNLLNNAFDAVQLSFDKWVKLEITENTTSVILTFQDSGKGIPKDIQDKIMEPFFTTKNADKGTGLGLSLSKGLTESHGGSLVLDTKARHTTFVITIPKSRKS